MTNARMWLVHRPTGKRALLAKKGAEIWCQFEAIDTDLGKLFEEVFEAEDRRDDFEIEIGG